MTFEVTLQRNFYVKLSKNGNIWIFSWVHSYMYHIDLILVLEWWQLIKYLLSVEQLMGKAGLFPSIIKLPWLVIIAHVLKLLWLLILRVLNIFTSYSCLNMLIWCQDKTCIVSLFCHLNFHFQVFLFFISLECMYIL